MIVFVATVAGCTTAPPVEEYAIAWTALSAARSNDSQRFAPSYWHEAEDSYHRGEVSFKDQSYRKAKHEFLTSTDWSEKAENVSRIQRFRSGEVAP